MSGVPATAPVTGWAPVLARGSGFTAAGGALIGGVLLTVDQPLVGTFVGALEGGVAGAVAGLVDGGLLRLTRACGPTGPRARARTVSGLVWLGAAVAFDDGGTVSRVLGQPTGRAVVALVCLALGAVAGPLIGAGVDPVLRVHRRVVPVASVASRLLGAGAVAGSGCGAVVGLVIGLSIHPPTAAFAVIEGAILGSVVGTVLALLIGVIVLLPLVRPVGPDPGRPGRRGTRGRDG